MSIELTLTGVNSPYLRHYMGLWSMDDAAFDHELAQIEQVNLSLHVAARNQQAEQAKELGSNSAKPRYGFDLSSDGIAVVEIAGTLMKHEASLMESTSTVMMRRTLRAMAADSSVRGVMLAIDSPGGTVSGNDELAADVVALAQVKPVTAYISGMGASAAYWIASQTSDIVASPVSDVGSIGTMAVIHDYSKKQEQSGVKIHVLKTGDFKGMGVPGTPIDQKVLDEIQRRIDAKQKVFSQAVADGRGVSLEQVKQWADGRVHVAGDALAMGLIDHVGTMDAAMERLREQVSKPRRSRIGASMSQTTTPAGSAAANTPTSQEANPSTFSATLLSSPSMADRISTIEQACPGASEKFVLAQVKVDASVETAQRAWIKEQNGVISKLEGELKASEEKHAGDIKSRDEQITTLKAEADQLKAKVNTAAANSVNQPVQQTPTGQTAASTTSDPIVTAKAEWAANKDDCQSKFADEGAYVGYAKAQSRVRTK